MMQTPIRCLFMRGGTSRGPFFDERDLPADPVTRERVLVAVMGSPDPRQVDGLGGGDALTSRVGIVRRGGESGADLDVTFAQLQPELDTVDMSANCGNMLAAVVPFAIETGMLGAHGEATTARVMTVRTGLRCEITVQTPGGQVEYEGGTRIERVAGSAAPIRIDFVDGPGSGGGKLLPTERTVDRIADLDVTCIDHGVPMVLVRAADVDCTGYETIAQLVAARALRARLEKLRLKAALAMGLGDVARRHVPTICLVAPPRDGGAVSTRCYTAPTWHAGIGVLAAVTVATGCLIDGTVTRGLATTPPATTVAIEHPGGRFDVDIEIDPNNPRRVIRAALVRTARLLMRGEVFVPGSIWKGNG